MRQVIAALLLAWGTTAHALSIFPSEVTVSGPPGSLVRVSFDAINGDKAQSISLVAVNDLSQPKQADTPIAETFLSANDKRRFSVSFQLQQSKVLYLCAVQQSQALYVRSCSRVQLTAR